MSKQDIEKRLGFAAQGVKATFAEFNVGDKVVATPNNHIDAYGRIIKIENGIATIASAEGNVKAKLSDLELVKKGNVEDLRRLGMKGFARPGVKAEFYASPEHLPMILAKTRKMHEDSKKAAEKYLKAGSVGNIGGAAGLANSMVNALERDLKEDLYRLTQSRNPVHKKAAKEAYAEIKAMADWWYSQYKKWTASRSGAKAEMALTISTVGAKNLCYEALANLGELAKLASETKSGWDFHVTVMTDHVKSAMSQLESSPAQAGRHLERAIDTLGMLRKIDPVRLNDIQKGSFKQLIGYVAKSLRDAKANIKVVTAASRPGVKAKA